MIDFLDDKIDGETVNNYCSSGLLFKISLRTHNAFSINFLFWQYCIVFMLEYINKKKRFQVASKMYWS